jgi:predicted XRE-type DNA-binding protein
MAKKNIGSNFDQFLEEEGQLFNANTLALKKVIAWKIAQEMEKQKLTKTELAKRMQTSRAALNRLLDESDPSLTITTLTCAVVALGKRVEMNLA